METANNTQSNPTLAEKISKALDHAQREVEELAVQLALGKAEASDKFEELKKDFSQRLAFWKTKWEQHAPQETAHRYLEELRLLLALGKAEALETFQEQRKKIMHAMIQLEQEIKSNPKIKKYLEEFSIEYQKLQLKLEILKLKYELKKLNVTSGFSKEMEHAKVAAEEAFHETITSAKTSLSEARKDIALAFRHMQNALKKL